MKTFVRVVFIAMAAVIGADCAAPIAVGADFDPAVSMGRPVSFAWSEPDELPTGDARLDNNPFFEQRMRNAIERELGARGIRFDPTGTPGLLVHHHAAVTDRVEVFAADPAAGYTSSQYGPGTQVIEYPEGTWLVDVSDGSTGRLLWRGWSRTDVGAALGDKECMSELIDDSIRKMFALFPVPVGPAPEVKPVAPAPEVKTCPLPTLTD